MKARWGSHLEVASGSDTGLEVGGQGAVWVAAGIRADAFPVD